MECVFNGFCNGNVNCAISFLRPLRWSGNFDASIEGTFLGMLKVSIGLWRWCYSFYQYCVHMNFFENCHGCLQ